MLLLLVGLLLLLLRRLLLLLLLLVERRVIQLGHPMRVRRRVRIKEGLDVRRRRREAQLAIRRSRFLPELRICAQVVSDRL